MEGGSSELSPSREGERLVGVGVGRKGGNVLAMGSLLHSLGAGGGSLKCFQKMRKWSLPLEWLVTAHPLQNPGPSEHPPPRVWYIQGGSRLPWRANKGVRALLIQQQ